MPIISIAIQKGGSGKTTTTINLAAALQRMGHSVLLIDADPQASLTEALGIRDEPAKNLFTEISHEIRGEESKPDEAIIKTASGLMLLPSSIELAWAELELVGVYGREQVFGWILEKITEKYDFIFFDCPPSVGMLSVNALVASKYILMPVQAEYLPKKAVHSFMHHLRALKKMNKQLSVLGIVLTQFDERLNMAKKVWSDLEKDYGDKMFSTHIRKNNQLARAQEEGMDIFHYAAHSHGAEDYHQLALELLSRLSL
jgi:chromosome partitioning protein